MNSRMMSVYNHEQTYITNHTLYPILQRLEETLEILHMDDISPLVVSRHALQVTKLSSVVKKYCTSCFMFKPAPGSVESSVIRRVLTLGFQCLMAIDLHQMYSTEKIEISSLEEDNEDEDMLEDSKTSVVENPWWQTPSNSDNGGYQQDCDGTRPGDESLGLDVDRFGSEFEGGDSDDVYVDENYTFRDNSRSRSTRISRRYTYAIEKEKLVMNPLSVIVSTALSGVDDNSHSNYKESFENFKALQRVTKSPTPHLTSIFEADEEDTFNSSPVLSKNVEHDGMDYEPTSKELMLGRRGVKNGKVGKSGSKVSKKVRLNYSEDVTTNLMHWLFEHADNPYPTEAEKYELAGENELTLTQVNNWFINGRRRYLEEGEYKKKNVSKK